MLKQVFACSLALFFPVLGFAQMMDNLMISNNSKTAISFKGDNGTCLGQTGSRTIRAFSRTDFVKLCKNADCTVKIYADYSCASYGEQSRLS